MAHKLLHLHVAAEAELLDAVDWYFSRSLEAADRFVAAIEATFQVIRDRPLSFPEHLRGTRKGAAAPISVFGCVQREPWGDTYRRYRARTTPPGLLGETRLSASGFLISRHTSITCSFANSADL